MKRFVKFLVSILAIVALAIPVLCTACSTTPELVDYVSNLKLDLTSSTKKQEVTVRLYIDGDTTHFDPKLDSSVATNPASDFTDTDGYIKARYIAINTPESTGKIEKWGKKASKFTRSKLETAQSIIVESDDSKWNIDSSGSFRYVVWVWYKPQGETEYRNLNLEILQEGLAYGSSVTNNRYGEQANAAMTQARAFNLYVFSDEVDPDFPTGAPIAVTMKELRCNVADYDGLRVKVEGVVTAEFNNSVYIESPDEDQDVATGLCFGMSVYYGYQSGDILEILKVGNLVSVVGVVSYYEGNGSYQISGVSYNGYKPELVTNTTKVDNEYHAPVFAETAAKDIVSGKFSFEKEVTNEDGDVVIENKQIDYGEAIMSTSVTVKELVVKSIYTTASGNSAGAMSLTCQASDGATITVRTEVLKDAQGNVITSKEYEGKTITVKGIIEKYNDQYQVKCYRADFITIL